MNAGLFHLVFWWRDHAGSPLPWVFKGRHALSPFTIFFSTRFQQNAERAFRARRPQGALFGRGRLTERESRLPFPSSTPLENRAVSCKRRFTSARWEFILLFSNVDVTLKKKKENVRYCSRFRLIHTDGAWLWGAHNRHFCVTGSLCSIIKKMYRTAEDKILYTSIPIDNSKFGKNTQLGSIWLKLLPWGVLARFGHILKNKPKIIYCLKYYSTVLCWKIQILES